VAHTVSVAAPFADHTDAAIASGCIAAQVGAIERAVAAHARGGPVRCILSGGAAEFVAPHLAPAADVVPNLVLIGLQAVAASTHASSATSAPPC